MSDQRIEKHRIRRLETRIGNAVEVVGVADGALQADVGMIEAKADGGADNQRIGQAGRRRPP
jgi:hypothetical protein